jgi:hypothetical protein
MKKFSLVMFGRIPLLAALSLAAVFSAGAASSSLNPTLDAFVTTGATGNLVNSNYGGAGALSVAARGSAQGEFQSVLQFNLAGAKSSFDSQFGAGQWSLQSVTLQFTAIAPNNAIFNNTAAGLFALSWMQNDTWTEGTGTPIAPGATGIMFSTISNFVSAADEALGTFSFNGATSGAATYALALTPSFSADILSGNAVSLRMYAADSAVSYLFDSRSFGTTSARPVLTVNAVPEPGTVGLAGVGLGLAAWRRYAVRRRGRLAR